MVTFTALFDACVLYSAPLADLLMQLAVEDLFRARWTDAIHDEWIEGLLVEAQHPDEFVAHLLDLSPGKVCAAVKRQRESLKNPSKSVAEMLDTFAKQRLPETVARLSQFEDLL